DEAGRPVGGVGRAAQDHGTAEPEEEAEYLEDREAIALDHEVCEHRGPYRRGGAEDRDEAAWYELLGPEDDGPAPADIDDADDDSDRDHSPPARKGLAQRQGDDGQHRCHRQSSGEREYEWRNVVHADLDRGPRRSPN